MLSATARAPYIAPFNAKVCGKLAVYSFAAALSIEVLASLMAAVALPANADDNFPLAEFATT